MHTKPNAYQKRLRSLIGTRLLQVVYHTQDDRSHKLTYDYRLPYHTLDQAIMLQMDSGCWGSFFAGIEFDQHGVDFILQPLRHIEHSSIRFDLWDVSSHRNWSTFIGQPLIAVNEHWDATPTFACPPLYPSYVQLMFANQQSIWIFTAQSPPQEQFGWESSEEIKVIFDERVAQECIAISNINIR